MLHVIFRYLAPVVLAFSLWPSTSEATVAHQYENQAQAACQAAGAALAADTTNANIEFTFSHCNHIVGSKLFAALCDAAWISNGNPYRTDSNCGEFSTVADPYHSYTLDGGLCEDQVNFSHDHVVTNYDDLLDGFNPYVCHNGCNWVGSGPTLSGGCRYLDDNGNGFHDNDEFTFCDMLYTADGTECSGGSGNPSSGTSGGGPPGANVVGDGLPVGEFNCQNVDCTDEGQPPPGGIGDPPVVGDGGPLPGDDDPGPPLPPGDGSPNTPDNPGEGPGDVTGPGGVPDGIRDIDCNPDSNADCQHTGSAQGSESCDTPPPCSGDPVECATLYQTWAVMCYDGGSFDNPGNCSAGFTCEGGVLKCEMIRQARQQYCDLYHAEGVDIDPFDDSDFKSQNYQAMDDATEVDIGTLDTSGTGFGGSGGSCPAPFPFTVYGMSSEISLDPFCQLAPYIRIFVILAALLTGTYIVMGVRKV